MRARHLAATLPPLAIATAAGCFFPDYAADLQAEIEQRDGGDDDAADASSEDAGDSGSDTSEPEDAACSEGLRRCSGSTPQTCDDAGTWVDRDPCEFVCASGVCTGTCVPSSTQCDGKTPQTCNSLGEWANGTPCPSNCADGACTTEFFVGGAVSGLAGSELVLLNNGSDERRITADGSYKFPTLLASGAAYAVTIKTQPAYPPADQTCVVTNGTGAVADANVTNIDVSCTTKQYKVGGTVTGLTGSGLVLQNGGGDDETISGDGQFTFKTSAPSGSMFNVSVATQPSGGQACWISSGAGTVGAGDVTSVVVKCATPATGHAWEPAIKTFTGNDSNGYASFTAGLGRTIYFASPTAGMTAYTLPIGGALEKFPKVDAFKSTSKDGMCGCGIAGTLVPASGALFFFGGAGGRFDPAKAKWADLSSYAGGVKAYDAASAVLGDRIYRVGGKAIPDKGAEALATARYYDTVRDAWIDVAPLPSPIRQACAGAVNGKLYVFGGDGPTTYMYDPNADEWTTLGPESNIHNSCSNQLSYAWRGTLVYTSSLGIEQFDPATNEWATSVIDRPASSPFQGAAVVLEDDDLYLVGGADQNTTVYRLKDD